MISNEMIGFYWFATNSPWLAFVLVLIVAQASVFIVSSIAGIFHNRKVDNKE